MAELAEDVLPLNRWVEEPWPSFWQAPAFVANLGLAAGESRHQGIYAKLLRDHCTDIQRLVSRGRNNFQADLYGLCCDRDPVAAWLPLLRRRLASLFGPTEVLTEDLLRDLRRLLSRHPPRIRLGVLRTCLGQWTTTTRMHADYRWNCIWGCGGPDSIEHYLTCVRFKILIRRHWPSAPRLRSIATLLQAEGLKWAFISQRVYHTIKNEYKDLVVTALTTPPGASRQAHFRALVQLGASVARAACKSYSEDPATGGDLEA